MLTFLHLSSLKKAKLPGTLTPLQGDLSPKANTLAVQVDGKEGKDRRRLILVVESKHVETHTHTHTQTSAFSHDSVFIRVLLLVW
mmetsp:Transcript_10026/g.24181  ORF Transcript_10026/g.24181 Transcript_10026/m.24181 type:complete len:85 (-) Transcript_10026:314-568(-)